MSTPAEKRRATIAAKAAKEAEDNAAFQNKSRVAGGRAAKVKAKENAVWNQGSGRKRTLSESTVPVPASAKKAREDIPAARDVEQDTSLAPPAKGSKKSTRKSSAAGAKTTAPEDSPQPQDLDPSLKKSGVKSAARKHAAPDIDIDSDDERPLVQSATKKSVARKNKKSVQPTAPKPPQIVADSESESEVASASDEDSENNSPSDDDLVNEEEFIAERPKVISKKSKAAPEVDGYESYELDDVAAIRRKQSKGKEPRAAQNLFDSENESASDESMPDAPPRNAKADIEMAEKIQDFLVHVPPAGRHRRTASTSSGSSSRATSVPDSEVEIHEIDDSESDDDGATHKKPRQVSAARKKQADSEKPSVRRPNAATDAPSTSDVSDRTEASWHVTARLAYPAPNRHRDLLYNIQTLR
ncbi:hypothetical protein K438DRAFT_1991670 [Mycena galopus ATCC 62051]|nr:hypothetical protein K438DRAFT_1991670 [Mycena galopus ATCC 62051]